MFDNLFDTVISRRGTSCFKWDKGEEITGRKNLLPFWVADMDFAAPPPVLEALQYRLNHGVFGYTASPDSLTDALAEWNLARHSWNIAPASVVEIPGVVPFIHIVVQSFSRPGDAVVIQEPVYHPFRRAVENNGRLVAENPLQSDSNGNWRMDIEGLKTTLAETGAGILLLCSPHNPVGRVWTRTELEELAMVCRDAGVLVISDEIHADLVQPDHPQNPWLTLPEDIRPRSLSLISATKSFNLPGLPAAWAVVPDGNLRSEVRRVLTGLGMAGGSSSVSAYTAAEAAWRRGGPWLDSLLDYVHRNWQRVREILSEETPDAILSPMEGTYLSWIDVSRLGFTDDEIRERTLDSGIWLSPGSQFGRGGNGHLRMNLAAPLSVVNDGLERLCSALKR